MMNRNSYGVMLHVDNVNDALPLGLSLLQERGVPSVSRGMQTLRVPGPVSTVYAKPRERVLFDEVRDANPFFHLMESLWLLGGSNRVELPKRFLNNIDRFSDNGHVFHGAYGWRLRRNRGIDQIHDAVELLIKKPDTRQCVLSLWDPVLDLGSDTKDMPCNDMVMLDVVDGHLNMSVCNRSNDAIWGAYGANAVQFSMLLEFMSACVGATPGVYVQQSNNFHVYTDNPFWLSFKEGEYCHGHVHNLYVLGKVKPFRLADDREEALAVMEDCERLCVQAEEHRTLGSASWSSPYFQKVVQPVLEGYELYKQQQYDASVQKLNSVAASDWRVAMQLWVGRRWDKAEKKVGA